MRRIALTIIIACCAIFMSCGESKDTSGNNKDIQPPQSLESHQLIKNKEVIIPQGYTVLDVSQFGRFIASSTSYYLKQNSSGRIFEFKDGNFQCEIIPPNGMILVGVCSFGEFYSIPTYYCQDIATGKIFTCGK